MSVNKVILLGRVGNDPEVKFMPSGNAVVNISIATNRKWQDKDGIEKYSTDIISDNFTFVGSKSDSSDAFTPKTQDNNDFSNQDIIKDEDIPF